MGMEDLWSRVNESVFPHDDVNYNDMLFSTVKRQSFHGSLPHYVAYVLCKECSALYDPSIWDNLPLVINGYATTTSDLNGCEIPTCLCVLYPRAPAPKPCGNPLFHSEAITPKQVTYFKQLGPPHRVTEDHAFVIRPNVTGYMLRYSSFLQSWFAGKSRADVVDLLRTNPMTARAESLRDGVIRNVYTGRVWSEVMVPLLDACDSNTLVVGVALHFDFISPLLKSPCSSVKSKKIKVGAAHVAMLNLAHHHRCSVGNVCCTCIMDSETPKTINGFSRILVDELVKLGTTGLNVMTNDGHSMHIILRLLLVNGDAPAMSKFVGRPSHSRLIGCPKCRLEAVKAGPADPIDWSAASDLEEAKSNLRTLEQMVEKVRFIQCAVNEADREARIASSDGYRYTPFIEKVLRDLGFDVVRMTGIDIMHAVALGTAQYLIRYFFGLMDEDDKSRICRFVEVVNDSLPVGASSRRVDAESFFPPKHPKAATTITFVLSHSESVFHGVLSPPHFAVWCSFVHCCRITFAYELTTELINDLEKSYDSFVRSFNATCGGPVLFNMHVGLHIAELLRDYGPCFETWSFPFERKMGSLSDLNFSKSCTGFMTTIVTAKQDELHYLEAATHFDEHTVLPSGKSIAEVRARLASEAATRRTNDDPPGGRVDVYRLHKKVTATNDETVAAYIPSDGAGCNAMPDRRYAVNAMSCSLGDVNSKWWGDALRVLFRRLGTLHPICSVLWPGDHSLDCVKLRIVRSTSALVDGAIFRADDDISVRSLRKDGTGCDEFFGRIQKFLNIDLVDMDGLISTTIRPRNIFVEATRRALASIFPLKLAFVRWYRHAPSPVASVKTVHSHGLTARQVAQEFSEPLLPLGRIEKRVLVVNDTLSFGEDRHPVVQLPFTLYDSS